MKALILTLILFAIPAFGQNLPDSPTPKAAVRHSFWHLDKEVIALSAVQGAAETTDGIFTYRLTHRNNYHEIDPLARLFLGSKPAWGRMAPLGIAEAYGAALLAQHMKTSRHKAFRKIWWLPQSICIGVHTGGTIYSNRFESKRSGK
jgi:hypothetical protein